MKGIMLLGLIILAVLTLDAFAVGAEGQMANCPLSNRWAIATWTGPDNTPADTALATCGQAAMVSAYWLNPETQGWLRYVAGRPDITTLAELDNSQGILTLGSATAPATLIVAPVATPTPIPEVTEPIIFTGSGWKDTEDFHISSNQFTISWAVESNSPDYAKVAIFAYPAGETALYISRSGFDGIGSGYTIVHAGPGDFWLKILSANCTWIIEVKE